MELWLVITFLNKDLTFFLWQQTKRLFEENIESWSGLIKKMRIPNSSTKTLKMNLLTFIRTFLQKARAAISYPQSLQWDPILPGQDAALELHFKEEICGYQIKHQQITQLIGFTTAFCKKIVEHPHMI